MIHAKSKKCKKLSDLVEKLDTEYADVAEEDLTEVLFVDISTSTGEHASKTVAVAKRADGVRVRLDADVLIAHEVPTDLPAKCGFWNRIMPLNPDVNRWMGKYPFCKSLGVREKATHTCTGPAPYETFSCIFIWA